MSAPAPFFYLRRLKAQAGHDYWLLDFKAANGFTVLSGQVYLTKKAARHAIALVDPTGQHPVRTAP